MYNLFGGVSQSAAICELVHRCVYLSVVCVCVHSHMCMCVHLHMCMCVSLCVKLMSPPTLLLSLPM